MAAILIKNVPDLVKRQLKQEAHRNRRSVNQQALVILEEGLRIGKPIKFPKPIKPRKPVTDDEVIRIIRRARDAEP